MKIAIVSAWDEHCQELADFVGPNHVAYCQRHGYARITQAPWQMATRSPTWAKWHVARSALGSYDALFVLDIDTLFMDLDRPLTDFIGAYLTVTMDSNGLNTGAVLVRNTPWSVDLMARQWAIGDRYSPNPEQTALAVLLCVAPRDKWAVLPQRAFNSYFYGEYGMVCQEGEYQEGDFLLHLPGLPTARRVELFRGLLNV